MKLLQKIDSFGRAIAIFLSGMAVALLTSCGTYDLVYNEPVQTLTTTINYQYGVYGFGYYDRYGRFYGPNNIIYYGNIRPVYGPRIVVRSSPANRGTKGTAVATGRRGSGGSGQGKKAQ